MVGFPLLLIPLAVYNIIVFLMPGVSFADPLIKLTLMSGAEWQVTLSDIMLALGILSGTSNTSAHLRMSAVLCAALAGISVPNRF